MNPSQACQDFGSQLATLIADSEESLMERILRYAKARDYVRYTPTLQASWCQSISGLSASLIDILALPDEDLELGPDIDFTRDPMAAFGISEARRHRARGVDLGMFLGLMKYYRQSYADIVRESNLSPDVKTWGARRVQRFFDRVEIGFCVAWTGEGAPDTLRSLQDANRHITNEKNKYLTFFESMPQPAFLVDRGGAVERMNHAAVRMLESQGVSNGGRLKIGSEDPRGDRPNLCLVNLLSWLGEEYRLFMEGSDDVRQAEIGVSREGGERHFQVRMSRMRDVSQKFTGTVIIVEDLTETKAAEAERLKREKLEGTLELAGAVCHELNQPIMAVSGYSELTLMSLKPDHDLYGKIQKINEQVLRMGEITRKLMKITRYRSKRYTRGERILDIEGSSREPRPGRNETGPNNTEGGR